MPAVLECTFHDLRIALVPIHFNQKKWFDDLHDVWISHGVWTPDSYNFSQRGEGVIWDEREDQRDSGIYLKRVVSRPAFQQWWVDCTSAIGHQNNTVETAKIAYFELATKLNNLDWRVSS